jgi:hypothetical protein
MAGLVVGYHLHEHHVPVGIIASGLLDAVMPGEGVRAAAGREDDDRGSRRRRGYRHLAASGVGQPEQWRGVPYGAAAAAGGHGARNDHDQSIQG